MDSKLQIVVDNNQRLYGLTIEQKTAVKEALTYDNPKYKQAKQYGRSKYISIPPYLTYYSELDDCLEVPFGFDIMSIPSIKSSRYDVVNTNEKVLVNYPEIGITLRDDQKKALDGFYFYERPHTMQNNHFGVIQLPTGKGKSILGIYMSYLFKQKTLILVHKDDLVVGWKKDIAMCFNNQLDVGLIKAKSRKVGEQFTIATVQTLSRMSQEELAKYTHQFGMVIVDEAHHIASTTFNIVDKFSCYYKLGLSATPKRTDGLDQCFDLFFGGIVYKHKYSKDDKDILPVKVLVQESKVHYRPFVVRNDKGAYVMDQFFNMFDYKANELPKDFKPVDAFGYSDRPRVPHLLVDNQIVLDRTFKIKVCRDIIREVRKGHSCLALFTQKEHIEKYYQYLCRYMPKEQIMLYYGDSKEKSEDLIKRAESKEALITLGTLAKTTEGTNVKSWEVLFLVSSINNEKNVEQATGRIRRSKEGKLNPVLVYDYEHPYVATSVQSHFTTRKRVYDRLSYDIEYLNKEKPKGNSMFSRGY